MRTHMLMVCILTGLAVSCTRKMIQVPVHPAVSPTGSRDGTSAAGEKTVTPNDDSTDLANQLRDPDLLNQLDDPTAAPTGNSIKKPRSGKPVIINGSSPLPEPVAPEKNTPEPPIEKPELPQSSEDPSPKSR